MDVFLLHMLHKTIACGIRLDVIKSSSDIQHRYSCLMFETRQIVQCQQELVYLRPIWQLVQHTWPIEYTHLAHPDQEPHHWAGQSQDSLVART